MKKLFIVLSIIVLLICGCSNKESENTYKMINSEKLTELLKSSEKVYLVDVRTEEEYDASHIDLAINLSVDRIESDFENEITSDKDANIIVYCRSGARSKQAAETLIKMGYKNVYNFGSIGNWPYDLVK